MTTTTAINLSETSPRFAAAVRKSAVLAERANQIAERLGSIGTDICRAQERAFDRSGAARALMEAVDLDTALSVPASSELGDLGAERDKLNSDRERIESARLLCAQEVAGARAEASAAVCNDAQPEYRRLVGKLVDAVLAAHALQVEIDDFTNRLDAAGVVWESQLHAVPFFPLREIDHHAMLPVWLRECRRFHLTERADPPRWMAVQRARVW